MKSWVFDTNVVVAAHLSAHGPPGRLLAEVYARRLRMSYDARLASEYREVLLRPRFGLPANSVRTFLNVLDDQDLVCAMPLSVELPDPDDVMLLEVAAGSRDCVLVTANLRHFPEASRGSVRILSPAEAWSRYIAEL